MCQYTLKKWMMVVSDGCLKEPRENIYKYCFYEFKGNKKKLS